MSFVQDTLDAPRPDAIRPVALPRRTAAFPSPVDWRDQVIYFLLPDRFSNGQEQGPPLDPARRSDHRPVGFRWDDWSASGAGRFQGPLGPDAFRRRITTVEMTQEAARGLAPTVATLARAEGFPLHADSVEARTKD